MDERKFYAELKRRFEALLSERGLLGEAVSLSARALSPLEAIGSTKRRDYPILTGRDVMVQAECGGCLGQAFTDAPAAFEGTLAEVCALDIENDAHGRGIFIAALNAVMCRLGIVGCTVHCRGDGPELCAPMAAERIRREYGTPRIALIGYQPALLAELSKEFTLRVLDLDPKNIGQLRSGVKVEDGGDEALRKEACAWAGLILCTGSTICNGSIVNFLGYENALFYGTSIAGAAALMDLPRLCFTDELQ